MEVIALTEKKRNRGHTHQGFLAARPRQTALDSPIIGLQPLNVSNERDGLVYVPPSYQPDQPTPLILTLHGAGGNAQQGLAPFLNLADQAGTILVAPESRGFTWDLLMKSYGEDLTFIDQALEITFEKYKIDRTHLAIEGFSDGASYALSLGMINLDLFTHIIAFSPKFISLDAENSTCDFFISHGLEDSLAPIDQNGRKIVKSFGNTAKCSLTYREFQGGHGIPLEIAEEAMNWFIGNNLNEGDRILKAV